MSLIDRKINWRIMRLALLLVGLFFAGCASGGGQNESETGVLTVPEITAVNLEGRPLKVVVTTSIIGDVVGQIGGEAIELTTLIGLGQDSHSYEPAPGDLRAAANADVIFVNGWDLEEGLAGDLAEIASEIPIVPVSAGIEPLLVGEAHSGGHSDEHDNDDHNRADPHVWFSIDNVEQWVENVTAVLSTLDPDHAGLYEANAAAYRVELEALAAYVEEQIGRIPPENRQLVTNHDAFAYFIRDYDFELIGTVIPGASTISEPSASNLTGLIDAMNEHGLCTIFTETSVSGTLARTIVDELDHCQQVMILPLYTESIGTAEAGAASYIELYRTNVDTILAGLVAGTN